MKRDYILHGARESKEDFTWENYRFFEGYESDPNNGEWIVLEDIGTDISGTRYDAGTTPVGRHMENAQREGALRAADDVLVQRRRGERGSRGEDIQVEREQHIPACLRIRAVVRRGGPFNSTDGAYWTGVEEPEYGFNGRPIEPSNVAKSMGVDSSGFTGSLVKKGLWPQHPCSD